MDTRLNSFLVLCQTMNYRKAAEILHLSQPAVSKQIKSLEAEYGLKLFTYDGRQLRKSQGSFILESYANAQRANYENLLADLKFTTQGHFKIGLTKTIGEYLIIDSLKAYLEDYKGDLDLLIDNTDSLFKMLRKNELDFLIIEGKFEKGNYDYALLSKELFTGICSKQHRFAYQKINFDHIFQENLLIREPGSGSRNILESLLDLQGRSVRDFSRLITISSVHLIEELVSDNLGITFAYERLKSNNPDLASFKIKEITNDYEFNIVCLKGTNGLDKAEQFFRKNIRKRLNNEK